MARSYIPTRPNLLVYLNKENLVLLPKNAQLGLNIQGKPSHWEIGSFYCDIKKEKTNKST